MLKKILVLVLSLSIALVASVSVASATVVDDAQDSMDRSKVSVDAVHTFVIDMSSAVDFAAGDTMIFTYKDLPSAGTWTMPTFVAGDYDFNDGTARTENVGSCPAGANNVQVALAAKAVTVTACSGYTASSAGAAVTFVVGSTNKVTNPGTAGQYEVWITGTYGDAQAEVEVPIMADDQVSVSASVDTYISFDVSTSLGSNNSINLGELRFSSVTSSNDSRGTYDGQTDLAADNISLTLNTNAYYGTVIQVMSANAGLKSTVAGNYTLTSASETLAANANTVSGLAGYGLQAQSYSPTQGTLTPQSPFNGATTAVGLVTTSFATVYQTANLTGSTSNPIVANGAASVYVLAVPAKDTPAADDYSDTLTFRATSTF